MEEEILLSEEAVESEVGEALSAPAESTETTEEIPSPPVDYEAMAKEDLSAIKMLSPEFSGVNHLSELPFAHRFAELRELGLSVKEALFATLPSLPTPSSGKEHLRSSVPRAKGAYEGCLSPEEMRAAKDLFYGLSEKEIHSLYARVSAR